MKQVSDLYNIHKGEDIYVIGSGASLRVFPLEFLYNKITIACNMSWKNFDKKHSPKYAITMHPNLNIPEFSDQEEIRKNMTWIVKQDKAKKKLTEKQLKYANKHFYYFNANGQPNTASVYDPSSSGRIREWLLKPSENNLYLWSSVAQAAVNLAANMGAKNIILVGCDNCSINENHHAHFQHTRWKGVAPDYRYRQYYEGMAEVRSAMQERGVNVFSVSPFVSISDYEEDFKILCSEKNKKELIVEPDITPEEENKIIKAKRMADDGCLISKSSKATITDMLKGLINYDKYSVK